MDRGGSDRTTTGAKSGVVINQKKKKPTIIIIKIKNNPSQKKMYNSGEGRGSLCRTSPISQELKQQRNKLRDAVATTSQAPTVTHSHTGLRG